MKFSTLAAVITALVASSSALPTPLDASEDLIDNVSTVVASNTGSDVNNNLNGVRIPRQEITTTIASNGNNNANNNANNLSLLRRGSIVTTVASNGNNDLNNNANNLKIQRRQDIATTIAGNGNGNLGNNLNGVLVEPRDDVTISLTGNGNSDFDRAFSDEFDHVSIGIPRDELSGLLNGNLNENDPKVLLRPVLSPKLTVTPTVTGLTGPRDLNTILNGDVNDNSPKVLVRPVVQPNLAASPLIVRGTLDTLLNGNLNNNDPKVLVRPVVHPKLTLSPILARAEQLSNNKHEFESPEFPFAQHKTNISPEIKHGDLSNILNGDLNNNDPKVLVRPVLGPEIASSPVLHL
jgi:hypothetical protein